MSFSLDFVPRPMAQDDLLEEFRERARRHVLSGDAKSLERDFTHYAARACMIQGESALAEYAQALREVIMLISDEYIDSYSLAGYLPKTTLIP